MGQHDGPMQLLLSQDLSRSNALPLARLVLIMIALMVSYEDADKIFRNLKTVVIDEAHALAGTKRGDQLALLA